MKADIDQCSMPEADGADMPEVFSKWYDAHQAVRSLRAIDISGVVHVLLTLEPTSDGDDTLPIWFANRRDWTRDLQLLTNRSVELKMHDSIVLDDFSLEAETVVLAEVNWRDPLSSIAT